MKKDHKFFIMFSGEYQGMTFSNNLVGIADTLEEARVLLQEIKNEDEELYGEVPKGYEIREQDIFTP
jgi:hypothetical protein